MFPQFAAALPGASILGDRFTMKTGEALLPDAEAFHELFLSGDLSPFAVPADRAEGLHALLEAGVGPFPMVKGQLTGPFSFGLMARDREKKPVFRDPAARDILVRYLLRVAQWQADRLRRLSGNVILALDEPYLAGAGPAIAPFPREEVIAALDGIIDGLPGVLCGVHCCGDADWGLVLSSKVLYLSFDAYGYAESLLPYPEEISAFLARGGVLAFGVVPTACGAIAAETPESLADRMEGILDRFASRGISREAAVRAAVITPACGLGTVPGGSAARALRLTVELSDLLRSRYGKAIPGR